MSEPKRPPPSPPASSAKRARGAPPDGPLSALPLDLLSFIFAFAPLRARLRTLGLVCKRWRTAALRSVTHLRLVDGPNRDEDTGPILPHANAALGLFPHLASLKLACDFGPCALAPPTTLTALTLAAYPLIATTVPAPPAWLSVHFPHLAFFSLRDSTGRPLRRALFIDFISRHNTSLTRLTLHTLHSAHEWLAALAGVEFPRLERLTVGTLQTTQTLRAFMQTHTTLRTLSLVLTARSETTLGDVPPALLTSLTRLRASAAVFGRPLTDFPRLRSSNDPFAPPALREYVALGATDAWDALTASPNARFIDCLPQWNGDTAPMPLPQLRTVTLSAHSREVRRKAASFLRAHPGLKELRLSLTDMRDLEPHALPALLEALCELGVRHGLGRILAPRSPHPRARPGLAELGWIELRYG